MAMGVLRRTLPDRPARPAAPVGRTCHVSANGERTHAAQRWRLRSDPRISTPSMQQATRGASGRVYRWAVSSVAAIGGGAFALSFLALRDLMRAVGYSATTAWIFPAIIDTAVAVSTLMLVALGDKPARRAPRVITQTATAQRTAKTLCAECNNRGQTICTDQCTGREYASRAGTEVCIRRRPQQSGAPSARPAVLATPPVVTARPSARCGHRCTGPTAAPRDPPAPVVTPR
jgi:Protein of unknown function (DUF2637)